MTQSSINFIEEFAKDGGALPEQRLVKRNILKSRHEAKKKLTEFDGRKKQAEEVKDALYSYYVDIISHADEELISSSLMSQIKDIRPMLYNDGYNLSEIKKSVWSSIFEIIDRVGKEIGVLKITRNRKKLKIGYEIFTGIGWQPTVMWKNWQRTKTNIKNLARQIKKKNKDARGLIFGEKGLGKTTFALWCMEDIAKINNEELSRENFVLSLSDIKRVRDENVSPYQIDELMTLLNSKRSTSHEHVETEEILSKFRHRNLFGLACTAKFDNLSNSDTNNFDFAVELIEEGKFKFYNKEQLAKFEKKKGDWKLPKENWIGHFPPLKDDLWNWYMNEIEASKDKTRKEIRKDEEEKEDEKEKVECNECGHTWKPRVDNPARCPKCRKPSWDEE